MSYQVYSTTCPHTQQPVMITHAFPVATPPSFSPPSQTYPHYPPQPPPLKTPSEQGFGASVMTLLIIDLILAGLLIGVLFAPSYHYTTIVFASLSTINFDIGLWRVAVTGNPAGIFGFIPGLAGAFQGFQNLIRNMIATFRDSSLADFQAFACSADQLFFQLIPSGCHTLTNLRIASYILASCLVISAVLILFGAVTLLRFWMTNRSMLSRRMVYTFHLIPGFAVFMGLIIYLVIGGVNVNLFIDLPPLAADVSMVDLSAGFFFCVGVGTLCLLVPAFMYFVFPEDLCYDSEKRYEYTEAAETDALVLALDHERRRWMGG